MPQVVLKEKRWRIFWVKPMIQHVYERACKSKILSQVIVATDDQRIYDAVIRFWRKCPDDR